MQANKEKIEEKKKMHARNRPSGIESHLANMQQFQAKQNEKKPALPCSFGRRRKTSNCHFSLKRKNREEEERARKKKNLPLPLFCGRNRE